MSEENSMHKILMVIKPIVELLLPIDRVSSILTLVLFFHILPCVTLQHAIAQAASHLQQMHSHHHGHANQGGQAKPPKGLGGGGSSGQRPSRSPTHQG